MTTPHNGQFLSPSEQSIHGTLMGISEEIEVATIPTDETTSLPNPRD